MGNSWRPATITPVGLAPARPSPGLYAVRLPLQLAHNRTRALDAMSSTRGMSLRDLMSAAEDDARDPEARGAPAKNSIGFLLARQSDDERDGDESETQSEHERESRRRHAGLWAEPQPQDAAANEHAARKTKKRKARICKEPGCQKYVVDHGLCIRHGGGKRCSVEDCNCRAQNRGLCWKHGGYTICKIEGCTKRAKSRGICWSHGGGTRCKDDGCTKIAVSHGKCWAHGGGKRCVVEGCKRPASERTDNCCADHYGGHPATRPN